jgi:uncharacterized membrane protein (UPF0127 family)
MTKKLVNKTTNKEIAKQVVRAESLFERTKGLLGRKSLPSDEVLWIDRCPSVHTFFMRFPIDVVFVDKNMNVTRVHKNLKPWRMTPILQFKNHSCFEFAANTIKDSIKEGDKLDVHS